MKAVNVDGKEIVLFDSLCDIIETHENIPCVGGCSELCSALNKVIKHIAGDFVARSGDEPCFITKVEWHQVVPVCASVTEYDGVRYTKMMHIDDAGVTGESDHYYIRINSEPVYVVYSQGERTFQESFFYSKEGVFCAKSEAEELAAKFRALEKVKNITPVREKIKQVEDCLREATRQAAAGVLTTGTDLAKYITQNIPRDCRSASDLGTDYIVVGSLSAKAYQAFEKLGLKQFTFDDGFETHWILDANTGWVGYFAIHQVEMPEDYEMWVMWYPHDYQYFSQKHRLHHWEDGVFDLEIVETRNFRTPEFLLYPEHLLKYCVEMGNKGYRFLDDFEYRDFGSVFDEDVHDHDFFKDITE